MASGSEKSVHGVVARDNEASKIGEKLAAEVEDDQEEVESTETDEGVSLRHAGLALEVVKGGVLGELRQSGLANK